MNKKGMELSLNVIIVAVVVVIVLIVSATFFLSGFGSIKDTIVSIFGISTGGVDLDLAIQNCNERCERAKLGSESSFQSSSFCKYSFNLDTDGDGAADLDSDNKNPKRFYCHSQEIGVNCDMRDQSGQVVKCQPPQVRQASNIR